MPFFRTVLLYCILFRFAMIESFSDCSDCGTYFSIHLRTSVPEQSTGKTVFHQPVQIKICCDKALFLSSHCCLYFPAAIRNKRRSVEKQGGFLSCIFFTGLHPLLSYTIGNNYRHQIGTVCVNHGNRIEQPVLCMARRELSDLLC